MASRTLPLEEEPKRVTDTEIQKGQVEVSAVAGKPHNENPEVNNMSQLKHEQQY
jgi:hypothetical protein